MMQNNPFGNFMNFMQQVSQFAQTVKGNPQDIIQNMLNSGNVSQQEYNQKYQQAQQYANMLQMLMGKK